MTILYSGEQTTHRWGVAVILDDEATESLKEYWALSPRVMLVKLQTKPVSIACKHKHHSGLCANTRTLRKGHKLILQTIGKGTEGMHTMRGNSGSKRLKNKSRKTVLW